MDCNRAEKAKNSGRLLGLVFSFFLVLFWFFLDLVRITN